MAEDIGVGDRVRWDWGSGTAEGEVVERFTDGAEGSSRDSP